VSPHPVPALLAEGVVKRYGESGVEALDRLDLEVPQGSFFGLLGPNGAGKTTLIRSVVGLTTPTAGRIEVFGVPAWGPRGPETRTWIGYAPQDVALDRFVSVQDMLRFHGRYFGMTRADANRRTQEMLEVFDLTQKRRRPRLVILDEPTAGVDLELRRDLWDYIRRLHGEGTTILLTTHYIEEAEALCERVAFIRGGRIAAEGTPDELRERFDATRLEEVYLQVVGR
jgi:ABC-2 type transport system ATP-binding protein